MLQLLNIRKAYTTAAFTQVALDDVSVAFRDNEFAAILGPSGSGKTTLLNILGGLDHADSGDIVINGVSTTDYTDRDWDAYRNHRIGFIFQSYNLIPHQTVQANVELALTLAGCSAAERRERARNALDRVGLSQHADKRPNQLSGGQMQRVAIARALVNDPDIVLADEPTGALDTETGIQVMELLKEIARDRLVVMVTHNPELAEEYATRIIRLKDGVIVDDTDPLGMGQPVSDGALSGKHLASRSPRLSQVRQGASGASSVSDATRHASMSFLTALALSFNNLMTKKGRTFMTAFAGSIGIIGIAAILALSNGVNAYIARTEEEALSSYPLTITKSSFDLSGLILARTGASDSDDESSETDAEADDGRTIPQYTIMTDMFAQVKNNDLKAFKAFLESGTSGIEPYVNSVQYSYGLTPQIYKTDTSRSVVRLNPSRTTSTLASGFSGSAFLGGSSMSSFTELLDDHRLVDQSIELVEGRWPEAYDECVFVMGRHGAITDYTLYSLGFYDTKVMDDMTTKALAGEEVEVPKVEETFTRDDALGMHFAVVPASLLYQRNDEQGTWTDMTGDKRYMRRIIAEEAIDLHVVGIVQQSEDANSTGVPEGIAYTSALTRRLMDLAADSDIVRAQKGRPKVDVFTGKTFDELADEEGQNFDMESMFEIDEEALRVAFSFDTSALSSLGQGMDFSGLDLGSSLNDMDMSDLDLSKLDTSKLSSVFDEKTMAKVMAGAPDFSMGGVDLGGDLTSVELTKEQRKKVNDAVDALGADFLKWVSQQEGVLDGDSQPDMTALFQAYLQTEGAQAILAPVMEELSAALGEQIAQQVGAAMNTYLSEQLMPYLMGALMGLGPEQLAEGIDSETMAQIMEGAPQFSMEQLDLTGMELSEEQLEKINGATDALSAGFSAWLMQNPQMIAGEGEEVDYAKLMEDYLKTESAQKIMGPVMSELTKGMGSQMEEAIGGAMKTYMEKQFAPYMAKAMGSLMESAAKALAAELGKAVAEGIAAQMSSAMGQVSGAIASQMQSQMAQLSASLEGAFSVDPEAFARAIQFNMTQEDLASLLSNFMNADELSYEGNLTKLGYAELESPESISIFPIDFPSKEEVLRIIDTYNDRMEATGKEDSAIQYSDLVGALMGSVTDIVNTISLVLIAFVSISLVVSSIMISIITYISVLERKKEIGILRAMGASKLNVANIFNAETVIEGFFAGVLAVTVVYVASVPVNEIVYRLKNVPDIMQLPLASALGLVGISVILTLVAGLIPSSAAARRDPVEALRSE